jgi:hypothetical protein
MSADRKSAGLPDGERQLKGERSKQARTAKAYGRSLIRVVPDYRRPNSANSEPFIYNSGDDYSFHIDVLLPPRGFTARTSVNNQPVLRSPHFLLKDQVSDSG